LFRANRKYEDTMNENFKKVETVLCKKMMDCIVKPVLLKEKTLKTKRLSVSKARVILFIFS